MKFLVRWTFRLAILGIVLLVAALLLKDTVLKAVAERRIRQGTGMDATISRMDVGLLTPVFTMQGFKLYNAPEFGGAVFLEIPEVYLEDDPVAAATGKFHLKRVRLNLAQVNIVKSKSGKLNVDELKEVDAAGKGSKKSKDKSQGFEFGGIDVLHLSLGKIRYDDLQNPKNSRVYNLDLKNEEVRNLKTEEDVQNWMASLLLRLWIQESIKGSAGLSIPGFSPGSARPRR